MKLYRGIKLIGDFSNPVLFRNQWRTLLHSDEDYTRFECFFLAWRSAAEVPVLHASKLLILMYNSLLSYKRSIYVNWKI